MSNKYIIVEDESVVKYFKDIKKSEKMSPEEEYILSKRAQNGDRKALEKMVTANLKFVVKIAKEYQGQGLSLSDLINDGNEGLIKAATKFDRDKGCKFISYAVWWIRQSIRESLNNYSRTIRLPTNVVTKIYSNKKDTNRFMLENGRTPEYGEVYINNKGEEVVEDFVTPSCESFNINTNDDDDYKNNLLDVIVDSSFETIYEIEGVREKRVKEEINNILSVLSKRERNIIELYFGINSDLEEGVTLEAIGDTYNLSKERVRQIKDKAIKKLRHNVHTLAILINE